MNLKFSGTNFLSDLREADNILKIDKFSISYNDKISDDDIKYDLLSIWIKEKNLLKLSIDLTNLMENLNNISIVCYYTSKSRNNNVVENTSKPAFILKPGTTEYIVRSINLIDLNFSNIKNILSDIKPVLPNELNLIESFSLDIGSSIFLIDDIDEKNLITKDSFEKKLLLKRDENNESVFDYGQTQLNSNGEFLYRKYIYRKYNEDQFFPEFICSDSGAVKKVEENITTYMISNNRSVLKLSGVVGYTDIVIENNKIIDKIEGYQKINEIPGLKIEKTYITDVINNIWRTTAIVENKVNVVVPENEESDVKEDFLTVSASFMNYDNSFINLSKKFKIIQSKLIRTGTRIWEVDYNLDNIKLDYEYYPEEDKLPTPVLIFQDKYKVTEELETEIKFQYINHEIIDKITETGGLIFSYEYLNGYEILLKTAEEVFNEFFEISVGDVLEDCSQIFTVKSKSVESYQTIDNWYPQVSIDGKQTQSTVIKVKISVNLDNYLDLEGFESEFIILRQPNISYRGYIDFQKSIDLKKSSTYDDSPLYFGTTLLLMNDALSHLSIEDETTDNYFLRNTYCGWCPDKFITDIPIIEKDITTDRYGGFVIGSMNDQYFPHIGKSELSIKFNSVNLKNYLKEGNIVNNSQIGTYIINGLSHYYFQKSDDRSIHDIFTRLKDSVSSWKNEIFMTSCNIPVYFGDIYGDDESHSIVYSSYNNSKNIPMEYFGRNEDGIYQYGTCINDIRKYCRIELNTEFPYKIIETSNVKVYYNGKLINSEDGILLLPEGKLDVVRTNASYYSNKAREDGLIITNNNGKEITTDCYFITETSSGLKQKIIIGWTDTEDIPYPYIPEGYILTVGKSDEIFENYPMSGFPVVNDLSIKDNIYQVIVKEPSDTVVGLKDIGFLLTITDDSYTNPNGGKGTQLRVHSNTDIYIKDRPGITASSIETHVHSKDENGDDYSSVLNNDLLGEGDFKLFRPDFTDEIKSEDLDSENSEKYYTGHYINLYGTVAAYNNDNTVLRGVRKFPIKLGGNIEYDRTYYTDQYYLSFCDNDLKLNNIYVYGSAGDMYEPYNGYYCNGTYMYTYGTILHTFYLPENSTIVKPGIYDKLGFISENDNIDVLICNNNDAIYDSYSELSGFYDSNGNYLENGSNYLFIRSSYYISDDTIGTLVKTKTIEETTGNVIESYNNYNIEGDSFLDEDGYPKLYVGTSACFVSRADENRGHLKDKYIDGCTSNGINSFDAKDFYNFFKLRTFEFIKAKEDKKATLKSLVNSKNLFIFESEDNINNCNIVSAEQSLAGNKDVFDLNYKDTANSIVPPKTVNINMKYLQNHKQEYIKFGDDIVMLDGDSFKTSPLVLKCSDPSITLGTFCYYKWFQSDIESISCGNKESGFVEGSIKYCHFGTNTNTDTRDSINWLRDLYVTNTGNNDVFMEKIEQENECPGGVLSGISRIPITLSLNNKYLRELSRSNYCKLFNDTDLDLLRDIKHFDYEFTINLVNNFQIHNETGEPFRYSQKVIIPWEGIDDTLAIFNNDINDSYIREIDSVVYGQNSEINIDLNEEKYNCSWDSTSYELTLLPLKIDDLINYKNSNYQLTGNIDYYAFDNDDIQPVDQSCTVTQKNIVKTDSGSNLILSNDHNIRLVFPQNDSSDIVYRKFKIKCRHSNTTVTIKIAQRGLEDTAPIQLLNATETPLPSTESNILLHSSGTCLNYTNNLGVFKIKSKYDSIFDYTKNSLYLRYCYNNNDREVNMELVNQASIKKESDYYIITVRANFPPNFSGSLREGSLLIYSRNDENSARAIFNVYQGYLLPILSENPGKERKTEYLLSEINGEYICNVGTLDNPITYCRSDNTINSRYFSIKFIQHELICLATSNPLIPIEFGKFLSPGDGIIISSGYKINQTMESLESNDKKYCTIRYQSNPWEFLGNSKYIIDKDYNTDLIYKTDEDGEDDYPRLVHQFNISDMSNFKITEDDLIKITVRFSISDYKITENFLESTVNYKINSEVNTDYSPVKYVFYIKYN